VYTDPAIVDVATIYPELEPLRNKLLYTGYVLRESTRTQQSRAEIRQRLGVSDDTWLVVVGLGSGWKAEPLLELVIAAARVITEHHHARFLVLCGTKLDREMVFRSLRAMEDMPVFFPITFAPNPADYMVAADAFIGRGGYNTLAEVLLTGVPALIVPSRAMGDEQELHARRLADLGLCLRLDETGLTPDVLAKQVLTLSMRDGFNQPRYRLDGAQFAAAWLSRTRRIVGA
jgi:predicted glycosyltransferase